MSLGGVNPLHTSTFSLTGGLRPTGNALQPDASLISRSVPVEDESTVAIWGRLEDLRRQRSEAEGDVQALPRQIDSLRAVMAVVAGGTDTAGTVAERELRQAGLMTTLAGLKQGAGGFDLQVAADDDVGTVLQRLQDALNQLQFRLRQAPARIDQAGREMQRLQARLQQRDVAYDVETGALTYTHTGQTVDPTDLLTQLWDRMKESRKVERKREGKSDKDRAEAAAMTGLLALLASLSPDGKAPVAGAEGLGPQPLDSPDKQVRAYVMTQMVVNGGAGAPARVYQAKRSVFCDADEVTAGGMASCVVDSLTVGSRGPKEIADPHQPRQDAGPVA
jgi:prefoldin subunit 5